MIRIKRLLAFSFLLVSLPLILDFKAPDDFSWLKEFTPLTESLTVDHWEKDTKITFDENGWVQVSKKSNPVTLSQYALVCFDTYRRTGDSKYKTSFLNQVKYLMSENQYKELAKDRIGYPYNYAFHDLKADWYSGLAQAEAISVLIRYYYLTKDNKALPVIIKLRNEMLWPIDDGGLLAMTPEGGPWIEEYPNSKQNKHVLNGFMISILGLYEYTKLFPDDHAAKKMYDACLLSLKNSVKNYDTGNWLQYDRGSKSAVNNWYMKAQVIEMKMLFNITNDPFFYRQHLIWSTYVYNKPLTYIGCKINETNFAIPMKLAQDGWYKPSIDYSSVASAADVTRSGSQSYFPNHGAALLLDKSPGTYFQPLSNDSMNLDPNVEYVFKAPIDIDRISFLNLRDTCATYSISISYKTDTLIKWKDISVKKTFTMGKETYYQFNEITAAVLRVSFKLKKNTIVMIAEMGIQNSKKSNDSDYMFYLSEIMPVNVPRVNFSFDSREAGDMTVFYKFANSKAEMQKAKWEADNYADTIPLDADVCGTFYQFLVVLKTKNPGAGIKGFLLR